MTIDQLPYLAPTREGVVAHNENGASYKGTIGELLDLAAPDITLYASVAELGQTAGSATIAAVWTALGNNCGLIAASAQFADGQTPAAGTVDIYKDGAGGGWITLHAAGFDYNMTVSAGTPSGTWTLVTYVEDILYLENLGTSEFSLNAHAGVNAVPTYVASPTIPDGYTILTRGARAQGDARVVSSGIGGFWLVNTTDSAISGLRAYAWALAVKTKGTPSA